jgi:hypothetical protein
MMNFSTSSTFMSSNMNLATNSQQFNPLGFSSADRSAKKQVLSQESSNSRLFISSKFSASKDQLATSDFRRGCGEDAGSSGPRLISRCWSRQSLYYLQRYAHRTSICIYLNTIKIFFSKNTTQTCRIYFFF